MTLNLPSNASDLKGDALKVAAAHFNIPGRSKMSAADLRTAVYAAAETERIETESAKVLRNPSVVAKPTESGDASFSPWRPKGRNTKFKVVGRRRFA